jgi:hypothetical protein
MNAAALDVFRRGHLPVTGRGARPAARRAGRLPRGRRPVFDEIFHPVARASCAAATRSCASAGASAGADEMAALGRELGKLVVTSPDELPAP